MPFNPQISPSTTNAIQKSEESKTKSNNLDFLPKKLPLKDTNKLN